MLFSSSSPAKCFIQQRQQVAGTRHTHGAPPSSTASTWYVGPYSAGSLLLERSTESGHNAYFIQTDTDMHTGPHMCTQLTKKYTVKKLKSIISHFSRLSQSVNLSHCCSEGHLSLASVAIVTQGNNCWNYSKSIYDKNISSTICSNTLLTLLYCARKFYMSGPAVSFSKDFKKLSNFCLIALTCTRHCL